KPGGMFIVSTLKRAHIRVWQNLVDTAADWRHALVNAGFSTTKAEADFETGRFLFCAIGGGGIRRSDFYGEAIISPAYVRRAWTPMLEFIDYVGDDNRGPQALIVARKPSGF